MRTRTADCDCLAQTGKPASESWGCLGASRMSSALVLPPAARHQTSALAAKPAAHVDPAGPGWHLRPSTGRGVRAWRLDMPTSPELLVLRVHTDQLRAGLRTTWPDMAPSGENRMAGTNARGEDLPVAVLETGIMGSEIARNWSPRACAQRSGTGQHRSRHCCRTLARWPRAQRPRRSRMRGWSSRCCRPPRRYRP